MKILLERNDLWNPEVAKYLSRTVDSCEKCARTYEPKQARKVSLSSLNRSFNDLVCIDHFHLGGLRICHIMCASTRYSVGSVVPDTGMDAAINALDSHWISPFWAPKAIQVDQAFANDPFFKFLEFHGIEARPIPARRHNKNVLESKHKVIRDVFLRLNSHNSDVGEALQAQQSIRISNDLYGNSVCSSLELAKGFTRPIECGSFPKTVPDDLIKAQETIMAKRKLNLILRSKATSEAPVKVGDLVQVFIKLQHEKRGKWTSAKPVLSYEKASGIVTVPGQNGKKIKAAVEDVRFAISDDELAVKYQEAIDVLDSCLSDSVDDLPEQEMVLDLTEAEPGDNEEIGPTHNIEVGDRVEVYWSGDDEYYPGTI